LITRIGCGMSRAVLTRTGSRSSTGELDKVSFRMRRRKVVATGVHGRRSSPRSSPS
jgi:hypothetical protein